MAESQSDLPYGIVQLVYTTWDEVYVYTEGEIVDMVDIGGHESAPPMSLFEEYLSGANVSRIYDLTGDFDGDSLPDEIADIPERFLRERVEERRD